MGATATADAAAGAPPVARDCNDACSALTHFGQVSHCLAACLLLIESGCISSSGSPPQGTTRKPVKRTLFATPGLSGYGYVHAKAKLMTCAQVASIIGVHPKDFQARGSRGMKQREFPLNKVRCGAGAQGCGCVVWQAATARAACKP